VPTPFPLTARRVAAGLALVLAAAGCTGRTVVKDYGKDARSNFVEACTRSVSVGGGTTSTTMLAPKSTCECVYHAIDKVYRLPFSDLTAYEAKVDAYKEGDEPPKMPAKLEKAIEKCTTAGPSVPTTTTEKQK
jgi:hypothetical protein